MILEIAVNKVKSDTSRSFARENYFRTCKKLRRNLVFDFIIREIYHDFIAMRNKTSSIAKESMVDNKVIRIVLLEHVTFMSQLLGIQIGNCYPFDLDRLD